MSKRRVVNDVRRQAEKKYHDTTITISPIITPLTTLGVMTVLSLVQQGTADDRRIGNNICVHSLECRYTLRHNGTPASTPFIDFRMIYFIWNDDSIPTITTLMQTGAVFTSPYDHDLKIKRKILADVRHQMYLEDNPSQCWTPMHTGDKYLDWRSKKEGGYIINFQGTLTDAVGHIYCLLYSSNINETDSPVMTLQTRINYTDC